MLLKRWGANRNSGWTAFINNKDFTASWNKKDSVVELTVKRVNDQNNGQYNYEMTLSLEEISKILALLSDQALRQSQEEISQKLSSSTHSLLRLLIASGGANLGTSLH